MIGKNKKILLVNRDFQLRYTKAAIAVAIVSTILSVSVILYPLYTFEILRIPKFLPMPILGAMASAVVINVGLIGFLGVILTHRLAGPIYALTREFRKIGGGLWGGTLKIRQEDDLKYLVRCFNEMSEDLEKINTSDTKELEEVISRLKNNDGNANAVAQAVEQLQALHDSFKERILKKTSIEDSAAE